MLSIHVKHSLDGDIIDISSFIMQADKLQHVAQRQRQ